MPEIISEELLPLGERVRQRRIANGLTQQQLGEKVGVTGATIHRIESGKHATRVDTIHQIAKALHTEPAELYSDPREGSTDSRWHRLSERVNTLSDADKAYVLEAMEALVSHLETRRDKN